MTRHDAPRTARPGAPIRTPDQVQQAKRPDAPAPTADRRPAETPEPAGILGQLQRERAHD